MRGFFGFSVGEEFARELEAFTAGWPADPSLRPIWVADLHVTIKFLSEFSSEVFVRVMPELVALGPPPADALRAGKIALWPTVVALECEPSLALVEWHRRVNAFLEGKGFITERHPKFHPHVTLARRRGREKLSPELLAVLEREADRYRGREVPLKAPCLFQSQAEETGRKHRPILSPLFRMATPTLASHRSEINSSSP